jgi:diadenosine tetraphosphate (Ap4A) HIT family hydrolase
MEMMMIKFELHPRLAADCEILGELSLARVLLMKDANYPWVILVPKVNDIRELHELSEKDQQQLIAESSFVSARMQDIFQADKMNVAALGNMVPQLHVHIIARFENDPACLTLSGAQ